MVEIDIIKDTVLLLKGMREYATELLKPFVVDKNYSLEERWNIFIDSKLGKDDHFYFNSKIVEMEEFYADEEKYQISTAESIIEFWEEENTSKEDIDKLKEEILASFTKSWRYDW